MYAVCGSPPLHSQALAFNLVPNRAEIFRIFLLLRFIQICRTARALVHIVQPALRHCNSKEDYRACCHCTRLRTHRTACTPALQQQRGLQGVLPLHVPSYTSYSLHSGIATAKWITGCAVTARALVHIVQLALRHCAHHPQVDHHWQHAKNRKTYHGPNTQPHQT